MNVYCKNNDLSNNYKYINLEISFAYYYSFNNPSSFSQIGLILFLHVHWRRISHAPCHHMLLILSIKAGPLLKHVPIFFLLILNWAYIVAWVSLLHESGSQLVILIIINSVPLLIVNLNFIVLQWLFLLLVIIVEIILGQSAWETLRQGDDWRGTLDVGICRLELLMVVVPVICYVLLGMDLTQLMFKVCFVVINSVVITMAGLL